MLAKLVIFGLASSAIITLIAAGPDAPPSPKESQNTVGAQSSPKSAAVQRIEQLSTDPDTPATNEYRSLMPADEQSFISVVETARENYRNATNEMQKGAMRPARARSICATIRSRAASRWIGQVAALDSSSDGKGVIKIKIAPDLFLETMNNSFSDSAFGTLIDPASPLFAKVSVMKIGQWVAFSGKFFPSEIDCVHEVSFTLNGSITSPDFIMRFVDAVTL